MSARPAQLFVISAPSGAGKTSLVRALLQRRPQLRVSVSHTTRKPRPHERDGQDYYFVTPERFNELVDAGAFVEYARVFDNFYGTGREQVQDRLRAGHDVLLEIDWQGARQVRRALPGCKTVFILPPSRVALEQRLRERATDTMATIERRLRDASLDMSHCGEFDYAVVNDHFEQAVREVGQILDGAGAPLSAHRPELGPLLAQLTA